MEPGRVRGARAANHARDPVRDATWVWVYVNPARLGKTPVLVRKTAFFAVKPTDSELKGRWTDMWTDPPAEKWPFPGVLESRRIGASRCPSVPRGCASVDSTPKNSTFFFWRVWASFLPLTSSYLILGTVLSWGAATKGGAVSCSM